MTAPAHLIGCAPIITGPAPGRSRPAAVVHPRFPAEGPVPHASPDDTPPASVALSGFPAFPAFSACSAPAAPPSPLRRRAAGRPRLRGGFAGGVDTLTLANGDRITGTFAGFDGETLSFDTEFAGTLRIAAGSVAGLTTDGPVTLRLRPPDAVDGGIFGGPVGGPGGGVQTGRLAPGYGAAGGATLRVANAATGAAGQVPLADVAEMRPGTDLPRGLQWSGQFNLGGTRKAGNTESDRIHVDADIVGRSEADRLTARGAFNREITEGSRTEDNFLAGAQHDHFVTEKLFFYTNGRLERDRPADLRLRSTVGTGLGYQVFETAATFLSVEAGPSYTDEDLISESDRDHVSGRWALDFRHTLRRWLVGFHRHEGSVNMSDTEDMLFDSSTGLRFPLGDGFQATAQFDLKFDGRPAADANRTDRTYLLTVGYAW